MDKCREVLGLSEFCESSYTNSQNKEQHTEYLDSAKLQTHDSFIESTYTNSQNKQQHAHLCRNIEGYINILSQNPNLDSQDFFALSSYKTEGNNKTYPCYLITKKGCDMIANKMTGEKVYCLQRVILKIRTL